MNEGWRGSGHTQILGEAKYSGPSYPTVLAINTGQLLDEQVQQQPHKFAVVSRWQGVRLTYADLHIRCQQLARGLIRLGVRPGDRVAVLAGNSSEYVQLFFAITAIGAWIAILNPTLTISEIEGIVRFISMQEANGIPQVLLAGYADV